MEQKKLFLLDAYALIFRAYHAMKYSPRFTSGGMNTSAIFGFVNLVVNVLLSAVLNGEPLFRWQYLAALVFVCVGIWLVNKAPAKKEGK